MKLHIKNFRSIKQLDLELAPITVLYGHNGTGKSSALYAPLTMKNIVVNPDREVSSFFNYGFTSLGQFEEVVFDHNANNKLELGISLEAFYEGPDDYVELEYKVALLRDNEGSFQCKVYGPAKMNGILRRTVSFPYKEGDPERFKNIGVDELLWDGIHAISDGGSFADSHQENEILNYPTDTLKKVNFVPLGRGFFHPLYSSKHLGSMTYAELIVSNLLADNKHIEFAVGYRMGRILNKDFRVHNERNSSDFSLNSIDKQTGVGASLVNEGFGVNQLVHLLATVLHPDVGIVCIEEPEIHLHPTAIRRLARELADIVRENRNKRLIISTHSEQFIMSLLALVAEGAYSPYNLAAYLVTKEGKESKFHRQQVNENGQIEGGFASFIEGELEDMKVFLGV